MGKNVNVTAEQKPIVKNNVVEPTEYASHELAKSAESVFGAGVTQDIVTAAFFVAGKKKATVEEARKIVDAFIKKEVK